MKDKVQELVELIEERSKGINGGEVSQYYVAGYLISLVEYLVDRDRKALKKVQGHIDILKNPKE